MPSFFTMLGRIFSGKPVYDPSDQTQADGQSQTQPTPDVSVSPINKADANTFPVVQVKRVDTHVDGNAVQVYCYVLNTSSVPLVIDKVQLLGATKRFEDDLHPNEQREYLVYSGPALQNDQQRQALIDYKTSSGDYFEAVYEAMYSYSQENKSYTITELRLIPPIRDIYG